MSISQIYTDTISITNAQMKALPETPVVLIPAINGQFASPLRARLHLANWVADYADIEADATISVGILGVTLLTVVDNAVQSGVSALLAGGGPDGVSAFLGPFLNVVASKTIAISGVYDSDLNNKNLVISMTNGAGIHLTGGNDAQTLKVTVSYLLEDI